MVSPRTWGSASPSCRPRGRGLWRSWSPSLLPTSPRLWVGGEHEGSGTHERLRNRGLDGYRGDPRRRRGGGDRRPLGHERKITLSPTLLRGRGRARLPGRHPYARRLSGGRQVGRLRYGYGLLRLVRDLGVIDAGLSSRRPVVLRASAEVFGEETLGGGVELEAVLGTGEAVALVLEEEVFLLYTLLLHSGHDLLGLGLLDARVVRSLRDQDGCSDPVDERER